MPDTVWAPAWVDWRFGDNYVGWVPLAPRGYTVTIAPSRWTFVATPNFTGRDFWRHRVAGHELERVYSSTTVIHNRNHGARWYAGPPVRRVSVATGRAIAPVHVAPPRAGVIAQVHMNHGRVATVAPVRVVSKQANRPEPRPSAKRVSGREPAHAPVTQTRPREHGQPNEHAAPTPAPRTQAAPGRAIRPGAHERRQQPEPRAEPEPAPRTAPAAATQHKGHSERKDR
jgi:hypothetical protein